MQVMFFHPRMQPSRPQSVFETLGACPDIAIRDEEKEVRPDVRPQARKNRRCIRWNTLRIFLSEHGVDGRGSFAAAERLMSDRIL
jgi:hypothetical protein